MRSAAVKTGISPLFKQRNAAYQLRDGRLIDLATGWLDELCIELAMIDTGLSRRGADEGAALVSQFVLLVMDGTAGSAPPLYGHGHDN